VVSTLISSIATAISTALMPFNSAIAPPRLAPLLDSTDSGHKSVALLLPLLSENLSVDHLLNSAAVCALERIQKDHDRIIPAVESELLHMIGRVSTSLIVLDLGRASVSIQSNQEVTDGFIVLALG